MGTMLKVGRVTRAPPQRGVKFPIRRNQREFRGILLLGVKIKVKEREAVLVNKRQRINELRPNVQRGDFISKTDLDIQTSLNLGPII